MSAWLRSSPARKAAPRAVVSTTCGRSTGTPSWSACSWSSRSLALAPPFTLIHPIRTEAGLIGVGRTADLVAFRARTYSELLSRPQSDRTVLRAGVPLEAKVPDYRELDELFA